MPRLVAVDPRELRLPSSRLSGADPFKLQRQIAQFGAASSGMPPIWAYEGSDGVLVITNGVTRATRIAKLAPGDLVRVEVDRQGTSSLWKTAENRRHAPMIDPVRQDILRKLGRLSELAPEMRFGQLVANLAFLAAGPWNETLWDVEDEQLLAAIKQQLKDLSARQASPKYQSDG